MDTKSQDITDVLSSEGIEKLKKGQILIFNGLAGRIELKITKISQGKVYAEEVKTYSQDEVAIMDNKMLMELANKK